MSIATCLADFRAVIVIVKSLIAIAHQLDANGGYTVPIVERKIITESAFLRFFIAWESFLERTIKEYMQDSLSGVGNSVPRYVLPADDGHANRLVLGGQKYFDFSDPDKVVNLCKNFFDRGEPYSTILQSIRSDLFDLKTIRNSAAHMSSTTSTQLEALAIRKLGPTTGTVSVYELILASPSSALSSTILDGYLIQLDAAADAIANY